MKTYDESCYNLAMEFLKDSKTIWDIEPKEMDTLAEKLASLIQATIEDFIGDQEIKRAGMDAFDIPFHNR